MYISTCICVFVFVKYIENLIYAFLIYIYKVRTYTHTLRTAASQTNTSRSNCPDGALSASARVAHLDLLWARFFICTPQITFLRVIPALTLYSDIVAGIPSGSIYGTCILTFYPTLFLSLSFSSWFFLAVYLACILTFFWHLFWHLVCFSQQNLFETWASKSQPATDTLMKSGCVLPIHIMYHHVA